MSGEVVHTPYGRTYYVNVEVDEEVMRDVVKDVQEKFRKYYSTSLLNFIIDIEELRKPCEIKVKAKL
ncbi:MAG: hypothetical protein B6V02_03955 [Thermoprotei archaeon ex4572_64]|nr:MAG: hypothetical protein B6V02_03955 [Thermoprotei archaeon ex4572_64]